MGDLNTHLLKEMKHFFGTYKKIQNKEVEVKDFEGKEAARAAFEKSVEMYKNNQ